MLVEIQIFEVGPRDGFQNICDYIPVETKLKIIDKLVDAGIQHMQITSFVSPKAILQMRDAKEIVEICLKKYPTLDLFALVPNLRGAQMAYETGLKKVTNVISLSESHNRANINRSREQSLEELERILHTYPQLEVCVDIATVFGCPFEGDLGIVALLDFLQNLYEKGIRLFNLCDTIGVAHPKQVREIIKKVLEIYPDCTFQIHIHDTRNMGMVNTLAAIECGITEVQSTLGGLGGCPFAPGASGNTATEDLVYMLEKMGYETNINFQKLLDLSKWQTTIIQGNYSGHHIHIK